MKLAEALSLRADLQRRIAALRERLRKNARVQEGDTPAEDPLELLAELNESGFLLPLDALTVEECADAICCAFAAGEKE